VEFAPTEPNGETHMTRCSLPIAALLMLACVGQARAQAAVESPGYCAQYYPNANCQNYGPGNPMYPGYYRRAGEWPRSYGMMPMRHHRYTRHHR
jgi:hypothetical protein